MRLFRSFRIQRIQNSIRRASVDLQLNISIVSGQGMIRHWKARVSWLYLDTDAPLAISEVILPPLEIMRQPPEENYRNNSQPPQTTPWHRGRMAKCPTANWRHEYLICEIWGYLRGGRRCFVSLPRYKKFPSYRKHAEFLSGSWLYIPYSLELRGMSVYFSNPLWGARVFESARLIFKNLFERTLPIDLSLHKVPVRSGVPVCSRVPLYFSIPAQGVRLIESACQFERIR